MTTRCNFDLHVLAPAGLSEQGGDPCVYLLLLQPCAALNECLVLHRSHLSTMCFNWLEPRNRECSKRPDWSLVQVDTSVHDH